MPIPRWLGTLLILTAVLDPFLERRAAWLLFEANIPAGLGERVWGFCMTDRLASSRRPVKNSMKWRGGHARVTRCKKKLDGNQSSSHLLTLRAAQMSDAR